MAEAGEIGDVDIRILLEHVDGLEIDAIHVVDFAGVERVGARRDIDDREHFDIVEIGLAFDEVVGVALGGRLDARLIVFENERAGADALLPFDAAAILGLDRSADDSRR